jgi:hypothetical protein
MGFLCWFGIHYWHYPHEFRRVCLGCHDCQWRGASDGEWYFLGEE